MSICHTGPELSPLFYDEAIGVQDVYVCSNGSRMQTKMKCTWCTFFDLVALN